MLLELWDHLVVPNDLVIFRSTNSWLATNPSLASWLALNELEYQVTRALSDRRSPESLRQIWDESKTPAHATFDKFLEATLGKLVLRWLIYMPDHIPTIKRPEIKLSIVYYAITEGCNLRCPYCYASAEKALANELTTLESASLIDEAADMGTEEFIFTGGEPMLRRDLFDLAAHSRTRGMVTNIITNGTVIKSSETATKVASIFNNVTVSIDGGTVDIHEATRGKGTFKVVTRALKLLNEAGVRPTINHVVTPDNVDYIEALADLMSDIEVSRVRLMQHGPLGRGVHDGKDLAWIDLVKTHRFVWGSPKASNFLPDGPDLPKPCSVAGNCGLGGTEIYVNSLGQVYPCKLITSPEYKAGSIRRQSLRSLYDVPIFQDLRSNSVFEGDNLLDCRKCYIRGACGGGCRAYHMGYTGNIKRNARNFCRGLRHTMVANMWAASGLQGDELLDPENEAYTPRLLQTGDIHPVFDDWKRSGSIQLTEVK